MTSHNTDISTAAAADSDDLAGAFPFSLSDSEEESRYLMWVRNHANYMAVRGFLDYFRSMSALLRGVVLNFLIFLPALLLVAIGLAYSHHWMLNRPFRITLSTMAIGLATIVLFPIGAQLFKIFSYRRSLTTGSESSVKLRDAYEQWFGRLLIVILAVAIVESLPWLLELVHAWLQRDRLSWQGGLAAVTATLVFLSGSDKLLSVLSGAKKSIAIGLIGVLGVVLPVLVILYATDYLLYGLPPSPYALLFPLFAMALFVFAIFAAIGIGVAQRVFRRLELFFAVGLLVLALLTLAGAVVYLGGKAPQEGKDAKDALNTLLKPVTELAEGIKGFEEVAGLDPVVAGLFAEFQSANRDLQTFYDELPQSTINFVRAPPDLSCGGTSDCWTTRLGELRDHIRWNNFRTYWMVEQNAWREYKKEVSFAIPLASILSALRAEPEYRLQFPRAQLAQLARGQLRAKPPVPSTEKLIADKQLQRALSPAAFAKTARNDRNAIAKRGLDALTKEQWTKLIEDTSALADDLIAKSVFGEFAGLERDAAAGRVFRQSLTQTTIYAKALFLGLLAILIWLGCWLTVDVNLTSIHGLYRDRLASAFLIGRNTRGDVDIEHDLDLHHICRYEQRSVAPYHLINVALNLQASHELRIRDRQSDFFVFSKRFIGGQRTGYCRSETMEQVFPQMSLATAMAISAAAASPNMGRGTTPLLVAFMTLLNVRLGYWLPNPGLLEESADARIWSLWKWRYRKASQRPGFTFDEVFANEKQEIASRWQQVYPQDDEQRRWNDKAHGPSVAHGLVGIAYSGGGIRSAAINLGVTQALHRRGIFNHLDYMSTVSGGGYLGSSISALMRSGQPHADKPEDFGRYAGVEGTVVETSQERVVRIEDTHTGAQRDYQFSRYDTVIVKKGQRIKAGQALIRLRNTIGERFQWRVRPLAFLREMISRLDETHRWVNLSDGGHIENLAAIELLRRRCKYIIIGDGEADPALHFAGMATLMRYAYLDLGIEIDIDLDAIRLRADNRFGENAQVSNEHWAIGTVRYPKTNETGPEEGYLLYLKSSYTGDENEIIREYRHRNPAFPHESTADQFFDEGQFEAYRALGQHIAERALQGKHGAEQTREKTLGGATATKMNYAELEDWFDSLIQARKPDQEPTQ